MAKISNWQESVLDSVYSEVTNSEMATVAAALTAVLHAYFLFIMDKLMVKDCYRRMVVLLFLFLLFKHNFYRFLLVNTNKHQYFLPGELLSLTGTLGDRKIAV